MARPLVNIFMVYGEKHGSAWGARCIGWSEGGRQIRMGRNVQSLQQELTGNRQSSTILPAWLFLTGERSSLHWNSS